MPGIGKHDLRKNFKTIFKNEKFASRCSVFDLNENLKNEEKLFFRSQNLF